MYFQTPLHLSWFSTQWRPEASHWVHGGAISRRLMATFASWGACTVTSWSEEEKKDAAPERRRTLGWRVIWGQNIRGKLFRWYFQLLLWNLKTSSLRFKLDLMPPKRLVGRWMKTRGTKRFRGSLPLFKLRTKADREAWRKLVFSNCYMTGIWSLILLFQAFPNPENLQVGAECRKYQVDSAIMATVILDLQPFNQVNRY